MISRRNISLALSDEQLIEKVRQGSAEAYAELWNRHAAAAHFTARQVTSSSDPDDLVVEAFARILEKVRSGGGPQGAFRPYLYATIRNLARTWGSRLSEVAVADFDEIEDPKTLGDEALDAFDNATTVRAFASLPERWRQVLWYTIVEEMEPREVAVLLGVTANSAAALAYRAREGLRAAWLQAHVNAASRDNTDAECAWTLEHLGERARNSLSARNRRRIDAHLASCADCSRIAGELDDVGARLAMALLPLVIGGVAAAAWVSASNAPAASAAALTGSALAHGGATGASLAAAPGTSVAAASGVSAAGAGTAMAGAGAVTTASGVTAALAVAAIGLAVSGTVSTDAAAAPPPAPAIVATNGVASQGRTATISEAARPTDAVPSTSAAQGALGSTADVAVPATGAQVGATIGPVGAGVGVSASGGTLSAHANATAPAGVGVSTTLTFSGTATPGATVAVRAAGVTLGSVDVPSSGEWSLTVARPQSATSTVQVVQSLPIVGGALSGVLRILPLSVSSSPAGITVVTTTTPASG